MTAVWRGARDGAASPRALPGCLPAQRMVDTGATPHDAVSWLMDGIDQALAAAVSGRTGTTSVARRARPLLALPVLSAGTGGSRPGAVKCWTGC